MSQMYGFERVARVTRNVAIVLALLRGATYRELQEATGLSKTSLHYIRQQVYGQTIQGQQWQQRRQWQEMEPQRNWKLVDAYMAGATYKEMRERFGISRQRISQILMRMGYIGARPQRKSFSVAVAGYRRVARVVRQVAILQCYYRGATLSQVGHMARVGPLTIQALRKRMRLPSRREVLKSTTIISEESNYGEAVRSAVATHARMSGILRDAG